MALLLPPPSCAMRDSKRAFGHEVYLGAKNERWAKLVERGVMAKGDKET